MSADASTQLHLIAKKLRAAGERDVRLGVSRTLKAQALPLRNAVRESGLRTLPKSGGLAAREAASVRVSVLTSARTAGVRVVNPRTGASQADQGYIRHRVYGYWRKGVPNQQIPAAAGWWSDTLRREGPKVAAELTATIVKISAEIQAI